ncbi:hypothetical protein D3C78_450030 [compost metagenome]
MPRQTPAERLHIHHRHQAPGQQQAQGDRQQHGEAAEHQCLPQAQPGQPAPWHTQGPQRRQLPQAALAQGQLADEQRHAGNPQGQAVQCRRDREGAAEHLAGPGFEAGLLHHLIVIQGIAPLQFILQRSHPFRRHQQAETREAGRWCMATQPAGVDQHMALGVAIVGINAHHGHGLGRLARQLQRLPYSQAKATGKLLAEHCTTAGGQRLPGARCLLQQWPVLAVERVIIHPLYLHRPLLQAPVHPPAGQHRADGTVCQQARVDLLRLRAVAGRDVHIGGQALVQPADEGAAKTFGHAANPDTGGQGQQQRHQRQAQGR